MSEIEEDRVSRRQFVKNVAGAGAVAAAPMFIPSSALGHGGVPPPSDRVVVGGIGIGFRGGSDLKDLLGLKDAQFVAICDVRNQRREEVKSAVDQAYGNRDCAMYGDFNELLARDDIDAVLIATGDRWHAPLSILAARNGKDVYCEKPGAATIAQAIALADAFHTHGRVYQAGSQRHSTENMRFALELARTGALGKLRSVHAMLPEPERHTPMPSYNWLPAQPEPDKSVVDWDRWLGPVPWRPYNPAYLVWGVGGWYNFWDLHGGGFLEWGPHSAELCQCAAGADDTQAVEYVPVGTAAGPYGAVCTYANGVKLVMRDTGWMRSTGLASRFEGDAGWVESGGSGVVELSDSLRAKYKDLIPVKASQSTQMHLQNWLDAVKTRTQPRCNVDAATNILITCHAAYIAFQLGRKLTWDPATKSFVNDDDANHMRSRAMRDPWRI